MDGKDRHSEGVLGEVVNNGSTNYTQTSFQSADKNKSYLDIGSNPSSKVGVRPCAVIGPDRVAPPQHGAADAKKASVEPWSFIEHSYQPPPQYPYKLSDYQHPSRNISPRQTFQENMPRIMVPRYNPMKASEDHNFVAERNNTVTKPSKLNEAKFPDVPYIINPLTNEHKHQRSSEAVNSANQNMMRPPAQGWPPGGAALRPPLPYSSDMYQYPEYSAPRSMPVIRTPRANNEDPMYPEYYRGGNVRFEPYPAMKDRYPPTRYEYIPNYPSPYQSQLPQYPMQKYDLQKLHPSAAQHPHYVSHPQTSFIRDPVLESYQRQTKTQPNFNVPYHGQPVHAKYHPIPGNPMQNRLYQYPPSDQPNFSAVPIKPPHDANKYFIKYDNPQLGQAKPYQPSEGYSLNEYQRAQHLKNQMMIPNYPVNMHHLPYYRKDIPTKNVDLYAPFKTSDPIFNNLHTRIPSQFSPSVISPSDSVASADMSHSFGSQEDCGYASQSSTTSVRSTDSNMYKMHDARYKQFIGTPPSSRIEMNSRNQDHSDKKKLDLRQFLQSWNEEDDETSEKTDARSDARKHCEVVNNPEQLYVLGLVNVPSDDLAKYEHIQKVSKLPENIKGFTSIELLNQFEEAIESSNITSYSAKTNHKDAHVSLNPATHTNSIGIPNRPLSPLDVEAKISQSVIHKDVGCNFEIRPCSPKMLNVQVAAPARSLLGERQIEKVSNPVVSNIVPPLDEKQISICDVLKRSAQRTSLNEKEESAPSCKMIKTQFQETMDLIDPLKTSYSVQDLESNSGVCLASLPRLDNDIELSFPEVNQQFINANKTDSVNTEEGSPSPLPEQKDIIENRVDNVKRTDTGSIKNEFTSSFDCKVESTSVAPIRTNSVIIKNPENIDVINNSAPGEYCESRPFKPVNSPFVDQDKTNIQSVESVPAEMSLLKVTDLRERQSAAITADQSTSKFIDELPLNTCPSMLESPGRDSFEKDVPSAKDLKEKTSDNDGHTICSKDAQVQEKCSQDNKNVPIIPERQSPYNMELKEEFKLSENLIQDNIDDSTVNPGRQTRDEKKDLKQIIERVNSDELVNKLELSEKNIANTDSSEHNSEKHKNNDDDIKKSKAIIKTDEDIAKKENTFQFNDKDDQDYVKSENMGCSTAAVNLKHSNNYDMKMNNTVPIESNDVNEVMEVEKQSYGLDLSIEHITDSTNVTQTHLDSTSKQTNEIKDYCYRETIDASSFEMFKTQGKNKYVNIAFEIDSESFIKGDTVECLDKVDDMCTELSATDVYSSETVVNAGCVNNAVTDSQIIDPTESAQSNDSTFLETSKNIEADYSLQSSPLIESTESAFKSDVGDLVALVQESASMSTESEPDFDNTDQKISIKESENTNFENSADKLDQDLSDIISKSSTTALANDECVNFNKNPVNRLISVPEEVSERIEIPKEMKSTFVTSTTSPLKKELLSPTFQKLLFLAEGPFETKQFNSQLDDDKINFKTALLSDAVDFCLENNNTIPENESKMNSSNKTLENEFQNAQCSDMSGLNEINMKVEGCKSDLDFPLESEKADDLKDSLLADNLPPELQSCRKCKQPHEELIKGICKQCGLEPKVIQQKFSPVKHKKMRCLKRSLSESALGEIYFQKPKNDSSEDKDFHPLNKKKKDVVEDTTTVSVTTSMHSESNDYCNLFPINRRYSISSTYEGNVSFCILIDDNCVIAEEEEGEETICFTSTVQENVESIGLEESVFEEVTYVEPLTEETLEERSSPEAHTFDYQEESNVIDSWVEDVACVETVVSDDIEVEDEDDDTQSNNGSEFDEEHTRLIKQFYGDEICSNDIDLVKTLYETPQMDLNRTLFDRESLAIEKEKYENDRLEQILSGYECNVLQENDKENTEVQTVVTNSANFRITNSRKNMNGNLSAFHIDEAQDDTVHSCDLNNDEDILELDLINSTSDNEFKRSSSSPEVTSTTTEDKKGGILLKIRNYGGSITSEIDSVDEKKKLRCKLTEASGYLCSRNETVSSKPLLTKAAQKYIPPLKETNDLKIKLCLPEHSLTKLKLLKLSKARPKITQKSSRNFNCNKIPNLPGAIKKPKPNFEDVLKNIDEVQIKKLREKCKKTKITIPKMIIKKNENGSHYTSSASRNSFKPDLTGRKWQPWVFIEKNPFIEKMALKGKRRAIYSHRKKSYIFFDKFCKYKSVCTNSSSFTISKPNYEHVAGPLKYTIRLKRDLES